MKKKIFFIILFKIIDCYLKITVLNLNLNLQSKILNLIKLLDC